MTRNIHESIKHPVPLVTPLTNSSLSLQVCTSKNFAYHQEVRRSRSGEHCGQCHSQQGALPCHGSNGSDFPMVSYGFLSYGWMGLPLPDLLQKQNSQVDEVTAIDRNWMLSHW